MLVKRISLGLTKVSTACLLHKELIHDEGRGGGAVGGTVHPRSFVMLPAHQAQAGEAVSRLVAEIAPHSRSSTVVTFSKNLYVCSVPRQGGEI